MDRWWRVGLVLVLLSQAFDTIDSGAVHLDPGSVDATLASNQFVFINFYADWCRFSNMLAPIWDEAADKVKEHFGDNSKIVVAKVDCDKHPDIGTKFHINKYPTLKYVVNGQLAKKEYRGQRSAEALVKFVVEQNTDPIAEITDLAELQGMDDTKRYLLGYFDSRDSDEYRTFLRTAMSLKDECVFRAGFGETVKVMHPPNHPIVAFRPNKARSSDDDETFNGDLKNHDEFKTWAESKCIPLVREITFENAEELTEEGPPFLILFHDPSDNESIKKYTSVIQKELMSEKSNINFLHADGIKFAHPLHHLGKSKEDLPLIAIDSFRHMYLFPRYEDMEVPGKLKKFLEDLYSGKLHREFHYGPDPDDNNDSTTSTDSRPGVEKRPRNPPPSQFQHLGPSRNRYTLLHDEF